MQETFLKPKLTPKDFFLYAGALVALYWSAGSLIALLFAVVDAVFKDELVYYVDPYSGGIRFAIASLLVVFPISLFLFTAIKREALRQPEKFLLPFRRWLYALTVFVTAAALLGDLIALINSFLGGELTARFVLKALSVLAVSGIMFWYCLLEIRVRPEAPQGVRKSFLYGAALLVLAAIVYGFFVMGSPATIRKLRFDEQRIFDLQSIQWQVVSYWQQKSRLPKSLSELDDPISGYKVPLDPKTKESYELAPGEGKTFRLCALFELSSANLPKHPVRSYVADPYSDTWEHAASHTCFERTIDPDLYPVRQKSF